jgi:hypothetical protein
MTAEPIVCSAYIFLGLTYAYQSIRHVFPVACVEPVCFKGGKWCRWRLCGSFKLIAALCPRMACTEVAIGPRSNWIPHFELVAAARVTLFDHTLTVLRHMLLRWRCIIRTKYL